ncbi:PfkB family carbohydrate kinase [Candidatus Mycoplasma pogonae]
MHLKKWKQQQAAKINFWKNNAQFSKLNIKQNQDQIYKNFLLMQQSNFYNHLHLSPFGGLLNDPNGLFFDGKNYHIFYQWNPFIAQHSTKHWGHYITPDFYHFTNLKLAIAPDTAQDIDGVYSGGAFTNNQSAFVYWTGNVKANSSKDQIATSFTLSAQLIKNQVTNKQILFEVDQTKYTRNFRDPKPLYLNNQYYLIHGAQKLDLTPTLVVYSSQYPDRDFTLLGEITIKNFDPEKAFMYECPDFVQIDGNDILIFSTQGKNYFGLKNQNRDQAIALVGKMDWTNLIFKNQKLNFIDIGFDFYAPQFFSQTNKLLGWVGIPDDDAWPTLDQNWAHNLSLVREIQVKDHAIYQKPVLNAGQFKKQNAKLIPQNFIFNKRLFKLQAANIGKNFSLVFYNDKNERISFNYANGVLEINRSAMSLQTSLPNREVWIRKITITNFELYLDNSILEIYFNNGADVFTTKYWINGKLKLKFVNLKLLGQQLLQLKMNWKTNKTMILPGEALIDRYNESQTTLDKVGGAPLNVAAAINKWELKTYFLGTIGNDVEAQTIKTYFKKYKLSQLHLETVNQPTTIAKVTLHNDGERTFQFQRGADAALKYKKLKYDCLVLSSATAFLGQELLKTYEQYLQDALANQKIICFDPNYRESLYRNQLSDWIEKTLKFAKHANLLKLSQEEAALLINAPQKQQIKFFQQLGPQLTLITLGAKGVLAITPKNAKIIKSIKVKQVDSTGAGDTFFGFVIAQILQLELDWKNLEINTITNLIKRANVAAALVTTKKGGAESIPTLQEVDAFDFIWKK